MRSRDLQQQDRPPSLSASACRLMQHGLGGHRSDESKVPPILRLLKAGRPASALPNALLSISWSLVVAAWSGIEITPSKVSRPGNRHRHEEAKVLQVLQLGQMFSDSTR